MVVDQAGGFWLSAPLAALLGLAVVGLFLWADSGLQTCWLRAAIKALALRRPGLGCGGALCRARGLSLRSGRRAARRSAPLPIRLLGQASVGQSALVPVAVAEPTYLSRFARPRTA
jgi:hypothetical protein